jgi:hypothetical protein
MKSIPLFVLIALCVISAHLCAEPIDIRNTSGTELTVEIISTEGDQVTFVRTSDDQEFTIPLSMLDEPSQKKIYEWELTEKYQPDSAPFFKLGGEYVIPIDIRGNTITYFDANSQKQQVDDPQALKLREFVEENKNALGEPNPNTGFKNFDRVYAPKATTLIDETGVTAVFNDGGDKISFYKDFLSSANEPMLQKISYEIFLPKEIETSGRNYFAEFLSKANFEEHPLQEEIRTGQIEARFSPPLPSTLSSGKWVKNKAIVRTHKYATNMVIFNNKDNTPVGVRNIRFKPVEPKENLFTLNDLTEGYNLFRSSKPFKINTGNGAVAIDAQADVYYPLVLDTGYKVEIVIEYENGNVDANADLYQPGGDELHEVVGEINLRKRKESSGSRKTTTITYNSRNLMSPRITLEVRTGTPMILHRFDVSIQKKSNAGALNPLHR